MTREVRKATHQLPLSELKLLLQGKKGFIISMQHPKQFFLGNTLAFKIFSTAPYIKDLEC